MNRELSAQEAKDLAFEHKDNPLIYSLARNLEEALDGTRALDETKIDHLEEECFDLENKVDSLEGDLREAEEDLEQTKKDFAKFLTEIYEDISSENFLKAQVLKKLQEFEV